VFKIVVQGLSYLLMAAFVSEVLRWELTAPGIQRPYSEAGLVEILQSVLLIAMLVLAVIRARSDRGYRQLSVCMALVFLILFIRENDHPLDMILFHGSWKYFALAPIAALVWYFFKEREVISRQLVVFSGTAGFGMMMGGVIMLAYSRMFGRSVYWQEVMGDNYQRIVKNAAEEGVELLAIATITCAMLHYFHFAGSKEHAQPSGPPGMDA